MEGEKEGTCTSRQKGEKEMRKREIARGSTVNSGHSVKQPPHHYSHLLRSLVI